LTCPLLLITT